MVIFKYTKNTKNALNAAAAKLEGSELGSERRPWPQIGIFQPTAQGGSRP